MEFATHYMHGLEVSKPHSAQLDLSPYWAAFIRLNAVSNFILRAKSIETEEAGSIQFFPFLLPFPFG
jgi:hypothetical protein